MSLRNIRDARFTRKLLAAFILTTVVCATGVTYIRSSSISDEWDEVFNTARAVLAKLPDTDRIETVKDPALRDAVLRAYRALKSCAKVNKGQSNSQKRAFVADFERAFKSVQPEAERSEYRACAAKCAADGSKCEKDCEAAKKKVCACKMTEFGCFARQCLFP